MLRGVAFAVCISIAIIITIVAVIAVAYVVAIVYVCIHLLAFVCGAQWLQNFLHLVLFFIIHSRRVRCQYLHHLHHHQALQY